MKKSQNNLTCSDHSKPIEGYCKDCQAYICASCMFGSGNPHKSHTLISLDELADFLRELMDKNADIIHHEYCEGRSLDVRQAKKSLENQTNQLIERITKCANSIISTITKTKNRWICIFLCVMGLNTNFVLIVKKSLIILVEILLSTKKCSKN